MSTVDSRIASMTSRTAGHIHQLFVLSPEQSVQEAHELLDLIESKGGECTDWSVVINLVEKHLGKRLEWRNEGDKLAAEKERNDNVASYKAYLGIR